jgi:hypothetical protein
MKDIFALRLYTQVARLGGFSGAARECELSQSQASRIIADLESDLGTRLLSRGTRAVVPTAAFAKESTCFNLTLSQLPDVYLTAIGYRMICDKHNKP